MTVRIFGWAVLSFLAAFLLNDFLTYWLGWPGAFGGSASARAWVQLGLYAAAVVFAISYVLGNRDHSLRAERDRVFRINSFLIRAAFWAVLLIGLVDIAFAFLRGEDLLDGLVGRQLAFSLTRAEIRGAYEPINAVLAAIGDGKKLDALAGEMRSLGPLVQSSPPSAALERIKSVRAKLHGIVGVDEIAEMLGRPQRDLRGPAPDPHSARRQIEKAGAALEREVTWRTRAATEILPKLKAYETAIADTIGLRGQPRLPNPVAVDVAACSATPRDIYLNF